MKTLGQQLKEAYDSGATTGRIIEIPFLMKTLELLPKSEHSKLSLSKMGSKNPMWGKKHTQDHKDKQSKSIKKYFKENPKQFKLKPRFGKDNPRWAGDNITRVGVHDWIEKEKGKAKYLYCMNYDDGTCKGRLEWSNRSQKYLRKIDDWWVLCLSHHRRYDKHTHINGLKTRFKKGQKAWNKKH